MTDSPAEYSYTQYTNPSQGDLGNTLDSVPNYHSKSSITVRGITRTFLSAYKLVKFALYCSLVSAIALWLHTIIKKYLLLKKY